MYTQYILVEFHNTTPFIYKVVSDKPITMKDVWEYFVETEGINEERDGITFIDEPTEIKL